MIKADGNFPCFNKSSIEGSPLKELWGKTSTQQQSLRRMSPWISSKRMLTVTTLQPIVETPTMVVWFLLKRNFYSLIQSLWIIALQGSAVFVERIQRKNLTKAFYNSYPVDSIYWILWQSPSSFCKAIQQSGSRLVNDHFHLSCKPYTTLTKRREAS